MSPGESRTQELAILAASAETRLKTALKEEDFVRKENCLRLHRRQWLPEATINKILFIFSGNVACFSSGDIFSLFH